MAMSNARRHIMTDPPLTVSPCTTSRALPILSLVPRVDCSGRNRQPPPYPVTLSMDRAAPRVMTGPSRPQVIVQVGTQVGFPPQPLAWQISPLGQLPSTPQAGGIGLLQLRGGTQKLFWSG